MKSFFINLMYNFDYYIGYFMYKPTKIHRYHDYMRKTYGDRYPVKKS